MTGLIYVAIIAVWAVVLVPAWLRRHDHLDPERSADQFAHSMQTLAKGPSALGVPLPEPDRARADDVDPEVLRVTRPDLAAASAHASRLVARAGRAAAPRRAAARRRLVLAVLVGSLVVAAGLVAAGAVPAVALVLPAGLVVSFLGVARHQVRASSRRRSLASEVRPESASPAPDARRAAARTTGGTWEARTTPLPTYVTAPPASGFPRVIDTETPGAWTAAAMLERAQQEKIRAERMAAAKAEAIARAKAEQAAAEARGRDEDFLADQSVRWRSGPASTQVNRRRAVNE